MWPRADGARGYIRPDAPLGAPRKLLDAVERPADLRPHLAAVAHSDRPVGLHHGVARAGAARAAPGADRCAAGAAVIRSEPDYLYAQYTTRLMKYVDDVEFWFDPAKKVIQVRSASRLGSRDFGVNRSRIEAIRLRLAGS